jgi:8-oxo-dGTP diphosphatase
MFDRVTRLSSYGIILDSDRILLSRLAPGTSAPGQWTLPGGGIEFGESPEEGLFREVREETGLSSGDFELLKVTSEVELFRGRTYHLVRFFFRVSRHSGELRFEHLGSTDMCAWVKRENLADLPTVPIVQVALELAGMV